MSTQAEPRKIRELWDIAMSDDPDHLTDQEMAALLLSQILAFGPEDSAAYPCDVEIQVPRGDGTAQIVAVYVLNRDEVIGHMKELGIEYPA